MDANHRRSHLQDLRGRLHFLRTLRPDSDRYKLWLGDFVELVHVAYGPDSDEMRLVRAALIGRARGAGVAETDREHVYLDRLDALAALIDDLDRASASPDIDGAQ